MEIIYQEPRELDPDMPIKEAFEGRFLIVRIPLNQGPSGIAVDHIGGQQASKPNFPKQGVDLPDAPVAITVLYWEGSPGCRTVVVNGVAYEKC